jgi:hypothetical protein
MADLDAEHCQALAAAPVRSDAAHFQAKADEPVHSDAARWQAQLGVRARWLEADCLAGPDAWAQA